MLGKVTFWDKESGVGAVVDTEGKEYHIQADMIEPIENDDLMAKIKQGTVINFEPSPTLDNAGMSLKSATPDQESDFGKQIWAKAEAAKAAANLTEATEQMINVKEMLDKAPNDIKDHVEALIEYKGMKPEISKDDLEEVADDSDAKHEIADGMVDIYYSDIRKWYAESGNSDYVEQARDEGLIDPKQDIDAQIQVGQYVMHSQQVEEAAEWIKEYLGELPEPEEVEESITEGKWSADADDLHTYAINVEPLYNSLQGVKSKADAVPVAREIISAYNADNKGERAYDGTVDQLVSVIMDNVEEVEESVGAPMGEMATARSTVKKYEALKTKPMWDKQEILGVAHRMSDLDRGWKKDSMDEEFKYILHELLAMFEEGKTIAISPDQTKQGIDWLTKNIINAKGELRDTGMVRNAGFTEEHANIIKDFKEFKLVGFKHDEQSHTYTPIYRTIAKNGESFDYSVGGGWGGAHINIH